MSQAQAQSPMVFMIGSDDLLLEAFEHGAAGAISGIASACPELILPLYEAHASREKGPSARLASPMDEFIFHVLDLPDPGP